MEVQKNKTSRILCWYTKSDLSHYKKLLIKRRK
nr:MAG TPA: hypothetical protein [Caudoviricetes sp.]